MKYIRRKDIDNSIETFTRILNDNHRHIGNDTGWHQHLGTHKIGIVATAMALLFYKTINKDAPEKELNLKFIQCKQNPDGGWPYISNTSNTSNVESTCWALLALYKYDSILFHDQIENGVNWLLAQYEQISDSDNGWAFITGSKPRIYVTSFVLRVLKILGKNAGQEFESAKRWLINAQNDDGGWGELPDKGSSLFFTCYCVITLVECGIETSSSTINNAISWLEKKFSSINIHDQTLICYLEFIENGTGDNRIRIPFFHYVLPYIVIAFLKVGKKNGIVFDTVRLLLQRCSNGKIEHPMLENSRIIPIWILYDTMMSYQSFKDSYDNWEEKSDFFCLLFFQKKLIAIGKYNLFRLFIRIHNFIWYLIGLFALIFIIVIGFQSYYPNAMNWWENHINTISGQIILSLVVSAICALPKSICMLTTFIIKHFKR